MCNSLTVKIPWMGLSNVFRPHKDKSIVILQICLSPFLSFLSLILHMILGVGHKMWLLEPCTNWEEGNVFRGIVAYTYLLLTHEDKRLTLSSSNFWNFSSCKLQTWLKHLQMMVWSSLLSMWLGWHWLEFFPIWAQIKFHVTAPQKINQWRQWFKFIWTYENVCCVTISEWIISHPIPDY